jgi:hypothetical protein
MPTKRFRRTRAIERFDLDVDAFLSFGSGWTPPRYSIDRERARFTDWAGYLAAYDEVRDEFLGQWFTTVEKDVPFGEKVRAIVREQGMAALNSMSYDSIKQYEV